MFKDKMREIQILQDEITDIEESMSEALRESFLEGHAPYIVKSNGRDQIALDQGFNDWTDSLCKDGEITDTVYNEVSLNDLSESEWSIVLESALALGES